MSELSKSDDLFKTGKIFSASDEQLDNVLKGLASEWSSTALDALSLARVSIINTIKQQRHIDNIEDRNRIYTWIIIALSITAIGAQILPLVLLKCPQ